MKKNLLHASIVLGLMSGGISRASDEAPVKKASFKERISLEKETWSRGLAAAKKRHWHRKRLTAQERSYYNAVLKRVGGLTALLGLIGIGVGAKKYVENRATERARLMSTGLGDVEKAQAAQQAQAARAAGRALIEAAERGDLIEVDRLLLEGADVNARSDDGITALALAADRGHDAIVARFIAAGADLNAGIHPALVTAADRGHDAIVARLLAAGADLNDRNHYGDTALMRAAQWGRDAIVARLLDAGADVNAQNDFGQTALKCATLLRHHTVAARLLAAGADADLCR